MLGRMSIPLLTKKQAETPASARGSRIAFLEADSEDHASIRQHFPDALIVKEALSPDEVVAQCADAEAICTFIHTFFPAAVIERLPKLKLLSTRSVGYDHIDLGACGKRGILVCNVPDYGSHVIAEHVFALILSTLRHVPEAHLRMEQGHFDYHGLRGMALRGKTLGIIGTGRIGRKVAQIAHGFGMKILATDKCRTMELIDLLGVQYVSMDELMQQSDIITLHVPASADLTHMMDAHAFNLMKRGVILVNTARGSLIDSNALLAALESGKVGYALLDVLEHENNFEENRALIENPRIITTPHIAFYADDSVRNMYVDCFHMTDQWLRGETPDNVVKPLNIVCDLPPLPHRR